MQQDSNDDILEFRRVLKVWRASNARTYPWRVNRTPYRVAVAELMLRRTRADQVVPVFSEFMKIYPTLETAAQADPNAMTSLLRPLGLIWRANDMVAFFQTAHAYYGENLPHEPALLRVLPGVGDYVGAAIGCFSGGTSIPLIDTNIVRILGRVFGLDTSGEARRRRAMRLIAAAAVDPDDPVGYHYSLLDFGALVCTARNPRCYECPLGVTLACTFYRESKKSPQMP